MAEPFTVLLELLRAFPQGQVYSLATKASVLRGFEDFRQGRLSDFSWSPDGTVLSATVGGEARYRVELSRRAQDQRIDWSCTCSAWGPRENCKHVVCAMLTVKNLLNPGSFMVRGWNPGHREALLKQLEAGIAAGGKPPTGRRVPAAQRRPTLRQLPTPQPGETGRQDAGYAIEIVPGRPIGDVILSHDGRPAQESGDFASCPPELRGLLSPYLRHDHAGKQRLLARYLREHGGKHPLLLLTSEGERALRYLPAAADAARTRLDARPDGVRAAKVFLLGGKELGAGQISEGIALDAAAGLISVIADPSGWETWNQIARFFPAAAPDGEAFDGDTEAPEVDARVPVYFETGVGTTPPALLLKIEGRPTDAEAVQPRYRLSILPGGDADERLLRAEVLLGEAVSPPHPTLSRFLRFSKLRLTQALHALKRRSVLTAAFMEMLAAPSAKEAQAAIARAARDEAIDRHQLRHEVRDLLQAHLAACRKERHRLTPDGARWVWAPVEVRRELDLYRLPAAVFGWEIFREMPAPDLMRVPSATLQEKLPLLLEALGAAGIELRQDRLPVRGATWEFSFEAERKAGIDWFEIRPEIRCDGKVLGARDVRRILGGGGTVEIGGCLRVVDAAAREVLALLGGVRGGGGAKRGGRREVVEVPRLRILDWIHLRRHGVTVRLPPQDEAVIERLLHFERLEERPLPAGLQATLRPYQREGWHWLAFLYENGFGACLADDMGLGKTLQAITLLGGVREGLVRAPDGAGARPHLIVVPPSLLFNWENEIRKFLPGLPVVSYTGAERSSEFGVAAAVLTTYGLVRRDLERLKAIPFDVIVFDEAQAVKNAAADTSGAVRQLQARFKLAMTGTPVENHIGEYISILDLAVPGLLEDLGSGGAGARRTQERDVERIVRRTRPFVLRRTKDQILKELPPKVETDIYLDLTEHQKALYRRTVDSVRTSIDAAYRSHTAAQARIIALTALLRLRQICVSPRLVDPGHPEPSPKIGFLVARLRELLDEGHRALVFSQFTSFLDLLEPELAREALAFVRLDGSTPTSQRRRIVEKFQSGKGPGVFLLSLKAGGQGLNLTSASYVFHLDPWWNPAVENQASDRTHRIGQLRTVTITRILMRHTIEEKMMALKQRKLALYRAVLAGAEGAGGGAGLTREDLAFLLG